MKNSSIYILLLVYSILAALTIFFFHGTGDGADSVMHYLFARYAPRHPELYFNHWAKPVYVLLASPFAQFGFPGIKLFNAIVTGFSIFFTFSIAQLLNFKNALVAAVILLLAPQYYAITFSGLTEPLFALFVSLGVYAALRGKYLAAALVISFLPFVRSEGLIIIGVFGIYFLLKGKWRFIPALMFGHVVYSLAGVFVHHDILWVFTKIPYANMGSPYGSGRLAHFVIQFYYMVGAPIYILFWIGTVVIIYKAAKRTAGHDLFVLVLLGFFAFFIAHTLFWYLGIFNSMGLKRVLAGVMPLAAIIALAGLNFLTEEIFKERKSLRNAVQFALLAYICIFPFTSNKAALKWERDLSPLADQEAAASAAEFIRQGTGTQHRFLFNHPYLSHALDIDHFDVNRRIDLNAPSLQNTKAGDVVIWTDAFSPYDLTKETLDNSPRLEYLYNSRVLEGKTTIVYSVYEVK